MIKRYLRYYLAASNGNGHGMHSPFVFSFIQHVLKKNGGHMPPAAIEQLRRQLKRSTQKIQVADLGAGSRKAATAQRTVRQLACSALKPRKYAQLLYRFVQFYRPQTIIELGTSLGITTAYVSAANPQAKIFTIEGSSAIAAIAQQNFSKLNIDNVQLLCGNFNQVLPPLLAALPAVDLVYVDGNHRYQPTMEYFHQLLPKMHNTSVIIFDDIHWSAEMEQAWEAIKAHPAVQYSIDVFFLGFVFFRKEFRIKQHFSIRF